MTRQPAEAFDADRFDDESPRERRRRSLRLLAELVRPERGRFALVAVLIVLVQLVTVAGPALVAWGIDAGLPALAAGDASLATLAGVAYLAAALLRGGGTYWYLRASTAAGQRVLYDLRRRIFAHTQRLGIGFHERSASGRVISRQTNDPESIRELLEFGLEGLVGAPLLMLFTAISILVMDWRTGLLMLTMLVPAALLTGWFQRRSEVEYRAIRTHSARLTADFVETFTGIRAVQAFRRERANRERYAGLADDYRAATLRSIRVFGIYQPSLRLLGSTTVALVLLVGGLRVVSGELEVGVLLALVLYTRRFFQPIDSLAMLANALQAAITALEKISALLAEEPEIVDPERPVPLPAGRGRLEFDDVEFAYSTDGPRVLGPIELRIPAGETVALVGRTGAGKSTVAKLVARFYDVSAGSIALDGVDLRDLDAEALRAAVVMVTQESYLFSGSIADNIALGRPDARPEEIEAAARAIGAHDFIAALPEGYATNVHSRGGRLSAGQRQLVSFARAFLADPRVLILDEATSSLDLPSERAVQEGLEQLLGDRTALIIAHRLATVMHADRVLVVDEGRIVEDGSPAELVAAGGRFAELHRAWRESL